MAEATAKLPTRVLDFKEFEKAFNARRRENTQERQFAEATLSPAMIERAIRKRTGVELPDEKQGKGYYTLQELEAFRRMIQRVQKDTGGRGTRGVLVKQLLAMSTKTDIDRANEQIRYSRLYQVRGGTLKFAVPASGESGFDGHYQVRVRLEDWDAALVSGKAWPNAAKQAATGRISIDCQCGRHQYWYRYLAGVGGFAVEPPSEKDFPKIRNPSLEGAACKHVIKTVQTLQSPTVQRVLAEELQRQADAVGYGKVTSKYLTQADHDKLKRARVRATDQQNAVKAYKDYLNSVKGLKHAVKKERKKVDAEAEAKILRAKNKLANQRLKQQEEANKRLQAEAMVAKIAAELNKAKMDAVMKAAMSGGDPMQAATRATGDFVTRYASDNGMAPGDVQKIIEDNKL